MGRGHCIKEGELQFMKSGTRQYRREKQYLMSNEGQIVYVQVYHPHEISDTTLHNPPTL